MPVSSVELNPSDRFRHLLRDPVLVICVVILWGLLALFVLLPLIKLFMRTFEEGGRFTLTNILSILADPNQRQALWNSLLLGSLVGLFGTVLGFLFAFTAIRANLSKAWALFLDSAIILPLISPPFTTAIAIIFSFGPRGLITYELLGIKQFTVYGLQFRKLALEGFPDRDGASHHSRVGQCVPPPFCCIPCGFCHTAHSCWK